MGGFEEYQYQVELRSSQIFFWAGKKPTVGGGFKYFLFLPLYGEMIQVDLRIFFIHGWFNHQLENFCPHKFLGHESLSLLAVLRKKRGRK